MPYLNSVYSLTNRACWSIMEHKRFNPLTIRRLMQKFVVLFRAINVGANNMLPMKEFVPLF